MSASYTSTMTKFLETKRTFLPSELYLPEYARNATFFRDICILLDYLENSLKDFSNPKYKMIEQAYKDIVFKYKNIFELSEDALEKMLEESGFGNILKVFNLPLEKLQMFVLYLPLFIILKGTDEGYRLLLSLISQEFEIETSLDNPEEIEDYTYRISIIVLSNIGFDTNIIPNFIQFSRSYVYPILKSIVIGVVFKQLSPAVYSYAIIDKSIKIKCYDEPQ